VSRSGLARGFDFGLTSNRYVLILTPVAGVIAGVVTLIFGGGWWKGIWNGFLSGGSFFVAWALARELHPDRAGVAVVAPLLAPFGLLVEGPHLPAAGLAVLVARIAVGTTGLPLERADMVVIVGLGVGCLWVDSAPGLLLPSALMVAVIAPLYRDGRREMLQAAGLLGLLGLISLPSAATQPSGLLLLAGSALGALSILGPVRVDTKTDATDEEIRAGRVRGARFYALAAAAAAAITSDPMGLAPVWAVLAVSGLRPT
jgi:hypothetical protein